MPDSDGRKPKGRNGTGRVLIVSQNHTGHGFTYARLLAQAVLDDGGVPVVALTDDGLRSREYALHLAPVATRCEVARLPTASLVPSRLLRLAHAHRCERVLVHDGDRFAVRLGLSLRPRREITFVVLVLSDPQWVCEHSFARGLRLRFKRLALRRTARLARTRLLYLADPSQQIALAAGRVEGAVPAARIPRETRTIAPDPVLFEAGDLSPSELRRHLGLPVGCFWFLVAGGISPRKNLPLVLRALLPLAADHVGLFVCGELQPSVRRAVAPLLAEAASLGLPVVVHDRLQADHQLNCAIQAVDCVVVAYSTDAPTSMMSKSVRAGRRVMVAGSDSLRRWAVNLGIGLVGPLEEQALTDLFRAAMVAPAPPPRHDLNHRAFVHAFLDDATT